LKDIYISLEIQQLESSSRVDELDKENTNLKEEVE